MPRQPNSAFQNDNNYPAPAADGGDDMAAPLGGLYLFSSAPGTGTAPVGFSVDADGSWGEWETYLAFDGTNKVTVVADCFVSAQAEASANIPNLNVAQFRLTNDSWVTGTRGDYQNTLGSTRTGVKVYSTIPAYPFAAGFTIQPTVLSAPAVPATDIQWVTTVWGPTPPGFVVPGAE